ncbi:hypothetical protein PanWU01x14_020460 [Parasponia andersonii]|uniref:Uncharacterized protein n=1 Tax=Parasponia andersonii TaxID=3476 RepID=A0A2P5DYM2_PARAD|nr:hypothetical protein PanWU01x14_020460 [Parasponia andersonii]
MRSLMPNSFPHVTLTSFLPPPPLPFRHCHHQHCRHHRRHRLLVRSPFRHLGQLDLDHYVLLLASSSITSYVKCSSYHYSASSVPAAEFDTSRWRPLACYKGT